jgi:hypothetical protein
LIAGSGRSGTTWVLDALAEANHLRTVFEPLYPPAGLIDSRFAYAFVPSHTEAATLHAMFVAAVDGTLESLWTDYRKSPLLLQLKGGHLKSVTDLKKHLRHCWSMVERYRTYRPIKRRPEPLIKCIRANLMLGWVAAHFESRIALLMRHPGAVVESQLRFAEHWDPFWVLERYRTDEALMQGALRPYADFLKRGLSRAGALTANWCIENLVPASEAAQNGYCVMFYEELLEQPQAEWRRLTDSLGLKYVPDSHLLNEPSQQAARKWGRHRSETASYERSYSHWRERLPSGVLDQIASVLDAFGVTFYSLSENRPDVRGFMRTYQLKAGLPASAAVAAGGEVAES